MGIKERGEWEEVKRNLRELEMDIKRENLKVVGVGEM